MKNYFFGLLAVVFALGASAFTQVSEQKAQPAVALTEYAYFYLTTSNAGDENDASKWDYITSQNPGDIGCEGENVLCTIYAPIANPMDTHPDFTGISDVRTSTLVFSKVYKP